MEKSLILGWRQSSVEECLSSMRKTPSPILNNEKQNKTKTEITHHTVHHTPHE